MGGYKFIAYIGLIEFFPKIRKIVKPSENFCFRRVLRFLEIKNNGGMDNMATSVCFVYLLRHA